MTTALIKTLKELGFKKYDLEHVLNSLPKDIWINSDAKHLKRQRVNFIFTKIDNKWVGSLNVLNDGTKELYVIQKVESPDISEVVVGIVGFLKEQESINQDL